MTERRWLSQANVTGENNGKARESEGRRKEGGARERRARVGEIASRSIEYLPGAIGHRAAVSEHREPFFGGAGDAAGPNSSATHPASVRTAIAGIKQMLYGNFY